MLELVREGLATKRIASAIGISPRTIDKHVQHALDKLGVRTRVQAIALIDQAGPAGTADGAVPIRGSCRLATGTRPRSRTFQRGPGGGQKSLHPEHHPRAFAIRARIARRIRNPRSAWPRFCESRPAPASPRGYADAASREDRQRLFGYVYPEREPRLLVFAGAAILGGLAVTRLRSGSARASATQGAPSPVAPSVMSAAVRQKADAR